MSSTLLLVLPNNTIGGAERVMLNLFSRVPSKKFKTEIVVLTGSDTGSTWLNTFANVKYLGCTRVLLSFLRLRAHIASMRNTVVISSHVHVNIMVLFLTFFPGDFRVIIREANMPIDCLKYGHWPKYYEYFYKILLPEPQRIVSSKKMRSQFQEYFSVKPEKMFLMCNPVDVATIRRLNWRSRQNTHRGRNFIAIGKISRQKRFDRLVNYMSAMNSFDTLTIIGAGPEEHKINNLIQKTGQESKIKLLGKVENPWALILKADAMLLSSQWEGMPNVALEAICLGVKVVANQQCGGLDEVAEVLPSCALQICKNDQDFIAAMLSVKRRPFHSKRKNRLPANFYLDNVAADFEGLLVDVV